MTSMSKRLVALVPMRHDSERVPGKNYRSFAGQPLFHCVINTLRRCREIDQIVIDTDSPVIMESARRAFPEVLLMERPVALRAGTIPMTDIIHHDVQRVEADFYLQTHSTNPLLRPETISAAIDRFLTHGDRHDSLFSVTRHLKRYWDCRGEPLNHDPVVLLRTQDLEPVYEENSCMYLFPRELVTRAHRRIGQRPLMFELPAIEAYDIDEEHDFRVAEQLYLQRQESARP